MTDDERAEIEGKRMVPIATPFSAAIFSVPSSRAASAERGTATSSMISPRITRAAYPISFIDNAEPSGQAAEHAG